RVRPVLHLESRLARLALRIIDDVVRLPLGDLDDLGLRCLPAPLLRRPLGDPLAPPLGLGKHLLTLLDDPAGLFDLLGDGRPHLIEDLVDLLAVEANLVGERYGLRVGHEVVEPVDEHEYVHGWESLKVYSEGETGAPGR